MDMMLTYNGEKAERVYYFDKMKVVGADGTQLQARSYVGGNITSLGNGDFDFEPGVPVKVNIENGVAAIALAWLNGVTPEEIQRAMPTFAGPRRRFDFHLKKEHVVLIDDYAHHPAELRASILSVKELYAGRRVTGIFQPHLYTRTRDFAADFAAVLSLLDELILLDIYPAREEPIPGVTSQLIFDAVTIPDKRLIRRAELLDVVAAEAERLDVVLMVGAGDIELLVEPVKQLIDR